jgi:imidazole glycerol-phosphate synthase subunit HisH
MITIVDYGMGNLGSIRNTFQRLNIEARITSNPEDILKADKLILPGVGAFDRGMHNLNELGLLQVLRTSVLTNQVPVLGICLGMQLLSNRSEEGQAGGLGWIDAETVRFAFNATDNRRKIPHMGWNSINPARDDPIVSGVNSDDRFYFVHSYHISAIDENLVIGTTEYGYPFPSLIRQDNIFGIQCHPERSHRSGFKILQNFMRL